MQLGDLFDLSFRGRRESVGLECEDATGERRSLTFGAIDARANRMARALMAHGVGRGDRVTLQLANSVEFVDVFLACVRLGAIFVPVNVLYREREVSHIVRDAEPRLAIAGEEDLDLVPKPHISTDMRQLADEAAAASDAPVRVALDGDDPLAIVYTSGTTGRSKGALLSHNNFAANTANLLTCWHITSDDRYLGVLPLFHVHGLANGLCSSLAAGCRMRLAPRFDAGRAAELFESFRPTLFFAVPTIYVRLLQLPDALARRIGAGMRLFVSGSAPLPPHVFEGFRERFGHMILERYGMSETLMLISNPYEGERRRGTVGLPLPGVSTRLTSTGELLVKGPTVFSHYWRNDEATSAAFDDGWFCTGDLAERSDDGWWTLHGRVTDLIISGGFNIYPREIEELLLEQPGVREAAVVGVPDERRGEIPVAYLVTDTEVDESGLRETCGRALASFKVPRAFVRVDALPRNALGKVQKHRLPRDVTP
jgi:malonyl-CoA/methylmalonyl-CoA synthetase